MILNAYAILDGFLSVLRLVLGLLVIGLALPAWRRSGRHAGAEDRTALEDRSYLLFLLATVLLVVSVASWPLLYLLLQSYVPQWPGVMCIYGVTRVGADSEGKSRFLPGLLQTLQLTKPALVFLSGVWLGLHLLNRRTKTSPLMGPILAILIVLGLLAVTDATVEGTYLLLPKKEETLAAGCCTGAFETTRASRYSPRVFIGDRYHPWLWAAYYGVNLGMILALSLGTRQRTRPEAVLRWTTPLVLGAGLALGISSLFLIDIAAPTLLHRPAHHCPYDLLPEAPESVTSIVLFVVASFCTGWAAVLRFLADRAETKAFLPGAVRTVLALALASYLSSVVVLSVELSRA